MNLARASGVLLHVTSLPGGQGIGDLGPEAYRFVDWLAAARQQLWQVLPLGPTGYGNSPYASSSAFAGNPLLISLQRLVDDGLLEHGEIEQQLQAEHVDYEAVEAFKTQALRRAFERFTPDAAFQSFCEQAAYWLEDYVRGRVAQGANADLVRFVQYQFERQWLALKGYANDRGVRLVGDIPIFVADGSIDVLTHPDLFYLDRVGKPTHVAGVPPDLFSATGQRWGNPLYRWDVMARDGYRWWHDRLRRTLGLVDLVRIDHFRGFAAYWAVPASEKTAVRGQWRRGPGSNLFRALSRELGEIPIIVEDLGLITPDVIALRNELGYPGMKVLQFAFDGKTDNPYLPHNFTPDSVVYTGTHDNETTKGWYEHLPETSKDQVRRYLGREGTDIAWDFVRLAHSSVAKLSIVPVQDLLSLGNEARLNFPGKASGNWGWRLWADALTEDIGRRLQELTDSYGRAPQLPQDPPELPAGYPAAQFSGFPNGAA